MTEPHFRLSYLERRLMTAETPSLTTGSHLPPQPAVDPETTVITSWRLVFGRFLISMWRVVLCRPVSWTFQFL